MMNSKVKTFFVRHPDTNQSFGMVAYQTHPCFDPKGVCTGEIFVTYAFSFCHPRDKFTKKMAHTIAEGRLEKGQTYGLQFNSNKIDHKDILLAIVENEQSKITQETRAAIAHLLGPCIKFSDKMLTLAETPIYNTYNKIIQQQHMPSLDVNGTSMKEIYKHYDPRPVLGNMLGGPQQSEGHKCCGKRSMK